ncbi:unnamed protein product (macronuclear) [Paramecium tetraurelia]|uniref:Fungal lipase-type domain-containing protein n=1 Tax=Paramecium tetraurelia TaxID=5888 RepID=A0CFK9_PARTE|nr:uncharacterized protein GSPATT00038016001 [Paramecium tetraurelia]CAK69576.1 unnamed protein product [Paramecium tetraurelia]|eukprot:XP_001436973.1 hypothetical protein (macronuclear) [Paramecium tetraurelia strain d4-2]
MRPSSVILVVLAATVSATFIYNEDLAKEEAALSFAAYCPNSAITNWKLGYVSGNYPNIQNPQVFENIIQGTKGYIAFNPTYNAITVVFRGSSNIQNWLDNIQFDKVNYNEACKCQVHKGFLEAFNSLEPQLDTLFAKYRKMYPKAIIHVTGHSLGAAMATLYATQLAIAGNSLQLTTFGLPRVGDTAYYNYFSSFTKVTHFRVVHEKDVVPHVPPQNFGFNHVDREIWYHRASYTVCQLDEDPNCSDSVLIPSVADHSFYMGWSSSVDC